MTTLDELKRLLKAGTPGPWHVGHSELGDDQGPMSIWPDANMVGALIARCGPQQPWQGWYEQPAHDAALIVAAINALPELLDRVERLEAALKPFTLVGDNESVGDMEIWTYAFYVGDIRRARAALAKDATT
jgi:NADPH-dependent ferric siderophore reductase